MTPIDRFERRLPDDLEELAAARTPAYLDDLLRRTAATRQRPRWAIPERWLPMTIALRRPLLAPPMRLLAMGMALLLALLAVLAVGMVVSSPRPLPAMLAVPTPRNGLVAFGRDGDIWVADPTADGEARVLVAGAAQDDGPDWSPDGSRIVFVRTAGSTLSLVVAQADGSGVIDLTPDGLTDIRTGQWSPDSTRLAIVGATASTPELLLVAADGSGITPVDLPFAPTHVAWRPDGRALLVRGILPEGAGLYPVSLPDLTVGEPIITSDPTNPFYASYRGAYDFQEPLYSADGSRIVVISGMDNGDGTVGVFGGVDTRNFVMNADGSDLRMVEFDPTSDYEDGASFSPDGTRLAMVIRKDGDHQAAIVTLDGSSPPVATEARADANAMPVIWSPDGTQILSVRIADGVARLIDPGTGAETPLPWTAAWPDWQAIPG